VLRPSLLQRIDSRPACRNSHTAFRAISRATYAARPRSACAAAIWTIPAQRRGPPLPPAGPRARSGMVRLGAAERMPAARHPEDPGAMPRVRDFGPKGRDPTAVSSGLDSVAHSFIVCYGAAARPRRSRGHARTPPFDVHEKQRETCRPRRVSTLPRALVDSPRQPGPRSPVRATHSTRPTWKAPYPQ
jgi:hypothetical protein